MERNAEEEKKWGEGPGGGRRFKKVASLPSSPGVIC